MIALLISLFIGDVTTAKSSDLTYAKDTKPIFEKRCSQCYNSTFVNSDWLIYENAFSKKDKIKLRIQNRTMLLGNTMPQEERNILINWVNQGANR